MKKHYKNNYVYVTDYPIKELGDKPHKPAPCRKVKILKYDGDKYVTIKIINNFDETVTMVEEEIKSGHIYKQVLHEDLKDFEE